MTEEEKRIHAGQPVAEIYVCENCRREVRTRAGECPDVHRSMRRFSVPAVAMFDEGIDLMLCHICYSYVRDRVVTALDKLREAATHE